MWGAHNYAHSLATHSLMAISIHSHPQCRVVNQWQTSGVRIRAVECPHSEESLTPCDEMKFFDSKWNNPAQEIVFLWTKEYQNVKPTFIFSFTVKHSRPTSSFSPQPFVKMKLIYSQKYIIDIQSQQTSTTLPIINEHFKSLASSVCRNFQSHLCALSPENVLPVKITES